MFRQMFVFLVKSKILAFAMIGIIGFLIEAIALTLISLQTSLSVAYGRFLSFPLAVVVTWFLNRKYTFRSKAAPFTEGVRYFSAQTVGAFCNLVMYYALVSNFGFMVKIPVLPLFFSAVVGLIVNFVTSRIWVFK